MSKLLERIKECQPFTFANAKYTAGDLVQALQERDLHPVEKMWVESHIFNELYLKFSSMISIQAPFIKALLKGKVPEGDVDKIAEVIEAIYKNYYALVTHAPVSSPKLATGFRVLAILQDFESTYSPKFLDHRFIPGSTLSSKVKSQVDRLTPVMLILQRTLLKVGVPFTIDGLTKDQIITLVKITKWFKNDRKGDDILW